MNTGSIYVVAVFVAVAAFFVIVATRVYLKYRGVRVITCPETHKPAAVTVDATHAALSAAWDLTDLRLASCSRWPEKKGCDEACLKEITEAPADCLARNIIAKWFQGKECVYCHKPISVAQHGNQPALRASDGHTFDFVAKPAEQLIMTLDTYEPVCFNCHVAEQFRRQFPEMVTDSDRKASQAN